MSLDTSQRKFTLFKKAFESLYVPMFLCEVKKIKAKIFSFPFYVQESRVNNKKIDCVCCRIAK